MLPPKLENSSYIIARNTGPKKFWFHLNNNKANSKLGLLSDNPTTITSLKYSSSPKNVYINLWKYSKKSKRHVNYYFILEENRLAYTKDGKSFKYRDLENELLSEVKLTKTAISSFTKGFSLSDSVNTKKFYCTSNTDFDLLYRQLKKYCISENFDEDYVLYEKIGKGKYSSVYRAKSTNKPNIYGIKVIDKNAYVNTPKLEAFKANILSEIKILRKVNHYALPKLHSVYESLDKIYLIMDYYEGGNLCNRTISLGKYPEPKAARIMISLLEGLLYLHNQSIVHRDIKLENIVLAAQCDDVKVKLIDFGLSCYLSETDQNFVCGTPGYIAPEYLKGYKYQFKSEVFSLGIVLYCILSGTIPFQDENKFLVMEKNKRCNLKFPKEYWGSISDDALELLRGMTQADPSKRFSIHDCLNSKWIAEYRPNSEPGSNIESTCLDSLAIKTDSMKAYKKNLIVTLAMMGTLDDIEMQVPDDDIYENAIWSPKLISEGKYNMKIKVKPN